MENNETGKSSSNSIPMPKIIEIPKKQRYKPIQKPTNRHVAVQTLLQHSELSQSEIGKALNYTTNYVKELKHKLDKTTLVTAKRLKRAYKTLDDKMQMNPIDVEKVVNGEVVRIKDYPSHAVALDAAKRVIDQHQPIIQRRESANINLNLSATDWDGYDKFRRKE